ncbi:MAG: hypothetical protein AMXMBFR64_45790 [Myxococcales bacterium]
MSQPKHSKSESVIVYVQLLNEGTEVYRPALAAPTSPTTATILVPKNYDPEDEEWEFKPGTMVRLELRKLGGEKDYHWKYGYISGPFVWVMVAVADVKEPRG